MVEFLKILSPALTALSGGLMAVLGGLIVQRKSMHKENREFLREKIQEVYELTLQTEDWLQQETIKIDQYVKNGLKVELDNHLSKSKHIRMLLNLYFSETENIIETLTSNEKLFFDGMTLAYSAPHEFNKLENKEILLTASNNYFKALLQVRNFLEQKMLILNKIS